MLNLPKFITFDCYGTLTRFDMSGATRDIFADRLGALQLNQFVVDFSNFRRDEVLGAWKPYDQVIGDALERTCQHHDLDFAPDDGKRLYGKIPTWGPHPDVPEGLARIHGIVPLVILSNTMNALIRHNVEKLGVPFAHVFTAEDAGAYKPRRQAFEFMFDQLGCSPKDVMHVSCHNRYDLMTAYDMGIARRVFVDRGSEPRADAYATDIIDDIRGLSGLLGL